MLYNKGLWEYKFTAAHKFMFDSQNKLMFDSERKCNKNENDNKN